MAKSRFDQLRPYWGNPITVESGVGAPQVASLPPQVVPEAERIYKQTWAKALAATAVTRTNIAQCMDTIGRALYSSAGKRVGQKENFYVLNSAGNVLYQASARDQRFFQMLASAEVYDPLAERSRGMSSHEEAHIATISEVLIPDNGVVFETGAGTDWTRIRELDKFAKAKGSHLICHDLLPVITHYAKKEVPDVPYMAMMADPELIADCLKPWRERPLSFSLKNTVSSMAFSEMGDLFTAVKRTGAEQVLVSQSLGQSPHANVFFMNLRPQSIELSNMFMGMLMEDGSVPINIFLVAVEQAHLTLMNAMLEISRYYLETLARQAGLNEHETFVTEHTTVLGPDDDMSALDNTNFSHARRLWQNGGFNAIAFSPFGCHKSIDASVPRGHLKVTTQQIHLRFGKKPGINLPGRKLAQTDLLCPKEKVLHDFIDSTDILPPRQNLAKTASMLARPDVRNAIEAAKRVGVRIGLQVMVETYIPHHPTLQGLPVAFQERLIKGYTTESLF